MLTSTHCIRRKVGDNQIDIPACTATFPAWTASAPQFTFGGKPFAEFEGKPVFAELYLRNMLLKTGNWDDAVWIECYGGGVWYLRRQPSNWKLSEISGSIPPFLTSLLARIANEARTTSTFDVAAWKGDQVWFYEAKRRGSDRLNANQLRFAIAALSNGIPLERLMVVEWDVN